MKGFEAENKSMGSLGKTERKENEFHCDVYLHIQENFSISSRKKKEIMVGTGRAGTVKLSVWDVCKQPLLKLILFTSFAAFPDRNLFTQVWTLSKQIATAFSNDH